MRETWKPISGYEGLYEVSDLGRVRSLDRQVKRLTFLWNKPGSVLRPWLDRRGYPLVTLCAASGARRKWFVHRLVASAFVERADRQLEVNHLNFDPTDPRASNLEWCDRSRNIEYSRLAGRFDPTRSRKGNALTPAKVRRIWKMAHQGKTLDIIAANVGCSATAASNVLLRNSWKTVGAEFPDLPPNRNERGNPRRVKKLSNRQVAAIRGRRAAGQTLRSIADRFDVSLKTIWLICNKKSRITS